MQISSIAVVGDIHCLFCSRQLYTAHPCCWHDPAPCQSGRPKQHLNPVPIRFTFRFTPSQYTQSRTSSPRARREFHSKKNLLDFLSFSFPSFPLLLRLQKGIVFNFLTFFMCKGRGVMTWLFSVGCRLIGVTESKRQISKGRSIIERGDGEGERPRV